jgi:hypothetical protein
MVVMKRNERNGKKGRTVKNCGIWKEGKQAEKGRKKEREIEIRKSNRKIKRPVDREIRERFNRHRNLIRRFGLPSSLFYTACHPPPPLNLFPLLLFSLFPLLLSLFPLLLFSLFLTVQLLNRNRRVTVSRQRH